MRSQNLPGHQVKFGWQRTLHEANFATRKQPQGVLKLAARIIHMVWMIGEEAGGFHIPKASSKRSPVFLAERMKPSATRRREKCQATGDGCWRGGGGGGGGGRRRTEEVKNRCRCR